MNKAPAAFRTISEVSELLETPAHVLRFWESRFTQVKPVKRAGGRRYYRPADLALLSGIKHLLHNDGLTIRGVQKILADQGVRHVASLADPALLAANDGGAPSPAPALPETSAQGDTPEPATAANGAQDHEAPAPATPEPAAPGIADVIARVVAAEPGLPFDDEETAPAQKAPPMQDPPTPTADLPGLTALAARLRRIDPDDMPSDRSKLTALRARLVALHARRSEALVADRI